MAQVLAPQLQQSLALLQAPTLELRALVAQELEQNPLLEELQEIDMEQRRREEEGHSDNSLDPAEPPEDTQFDPAQEKDSGEPVDDFQAEFEKLVQLDQEWRDHFAQTNVPNRTSEDEEERRQYMFDSLVSETSLQEHILEQLRQSDAPEKVRPIAELVIGNIDDYGYLVGSVDELALMTGIPGDYILDALKLIQTFHPPGVGGRDLREVLMLQLERDNRENTLEYRILRDHMEALGRRRIPEIARHTASQVEQVQAALERIALLDPRPGRAFLPEVNQYVVPEVFVNKVEGQYVVTLNNEQTPHLRISNTYKDLMSRSDSSQEIREYIREKIRAGKFLIKSLHQRQQTILNIANEIVARQEEFLEHGVSHLKPMTMVQVAEAVGVHETTVSRAVSGKYMDTPLGVFEMKYFFTSGIRTESGEGMSNASVKEIIQDMVRREPPEKPYSDDVIVKKLKEKEIVIARRTVAKYRDELNILPSHLRRKVY